MARGPHQLCGRSPDDTQSFFAFFEEVSAFGLASFFVSLSASFPSFDPLSPSPDELAPDELPFLA